MGCDLWHGYQSASKRCWGLSGVYRGDHPDDADDYRQHIEEKRLCQSAPGVQTCDGTVSTAADAGKPSNGESGGRSFTRRCAAVDTAVVARTHVSNQPGRTATARRRSECCGISTRQKNRAQVEVLSPGQQKPNQSPSLNPARMVLPNR